MHYRIESLTPLLFTACFIVPIPANGNSIAGGSEDDETPLEAAKRETFEEKVECSQTKRLAQKAYSMSKKLGTPFLRRAFQAFMYKRQMSNTKNARKTGRCYRYRQYGRNVV
ncbi:MAG TPA: hypothetical protein IAA58_03170 [Candidatus Gallacutalibacter stercoravium]|nr:hypothetical protein [Candidatus Gallacutalibacter stercoravium]